MLHKDASYVEISYKNKQLSLMLKYGVVDW